MLMKFLIKEVYFKKKERQDNLFGIIISILTVSAFSIFPISNYHYRDKGTIFQIANLDSF